MDLAPSATYLRNSRFCEAIDSSAELFDTAGDVISNVCALFPANSGEVANAVSGSQRTLSCFRSLIAIQSLVSLKCIYEEKEGTVQVKDYLVVAIGVCVVAARLLCLASNMHALKLINMQQHLARINLAITALFTAVVTLNLACAARGFVKEQGTDSAVELTQATGWFVGHNVTLVPMFTPSLLAPVVVTSVSLVASTVVLATLLYQLQASKAND